MSSPRARVPAALSLLVAAAMGLTTPSYAEEPAPTTEPTPTAEPTPAASTVTFPETTTVRPGTDAYVVHIDASGYDRAWVSTTGWSGPAPAVGSVEVPFPQDGYQHVTVLGCSQAGACTQLATSPELLVRRDLGLGALWWEDQRVGRHHGFAMAFPWAEVDRAGEVAWELRTTGGALLTSGSTTYGPDADDPKRVTFALDLPESVEDGDYQLVVDAVDTVEGFGELRSRVVDTFTWDTRARPTLRLEHDAVYPVADRYLDRLVVHLGSEAVRDGRIEVLDATGAVVRTLASGLSGGAHTGYGTYLSRTVRWDGQDDAGQPLPGGSYTVRATVVDLAGNEGQDSREVHLGRERLVTEKWRQTYRASDTVIDRSVGRCSDYRTPSSRRDRGSFQLASQTRCTAPAQSHALALSGVYLPPSVGNHYRSLSIEMRGGPSLGSRDAYVVLGTVKKGNVFADRMVVRGGYGTRRLVPENDQNTIRIDDDGRRYALWQAGLSEGSRWDVETYTLRATIKVLR